MQRTQRRIKSLPFKFNHMIRYLIISAVISLLIALNVNKEDYVSTKELIYSRIIAFFMLLVIWPLTLLMIIFKFLFLRRF